MLRQKALAWTTAAAATIAALQLITPSVMDIILDILLVALVFLSAKLANED